MLRDVFPAGFLMLWSLISLGVPLLVAAYALMLLQRIANALERSTRLLEEMAAERRVEGRIQKG